MITGAWLSVKPGTNAYQTIHTCVRVCAFVLAFVYWQLLWHDSTLQWCGCRRRRRGRHRRHVNVCRTPNPKHWTQIAYTRTPRQIIELVYFRLVLEIELCINTHAHIECVCSYVTNVHAHTLEPGGERHTWVRLAFQRRRGREPISLFDVCKHTYTRCSAVAGCRCGIVRARCLFTFSALARGSVVHATTQKYTARCATLASNSLGARLSATRTYANYCVIYTQTQARCQLAWQNTGRARAFESHVGNSVIEHVWMI